MWQYLLHQISKFIIINKPIKTKRIEFWKARRLVKKDFASELQEQAKTCKRYFYEAITQASSECWNQFRCFRTPKNPRDVVPYAIGAISWRFILRLPRKNDTTAKFVRAIVAMFLVDLLSTKSGLNPSKILYYRVEHSW